jgi:hypothetical protein
MITFTEEEFEVLAKEIFAAGARAGIDIGVESVTSYETGSCNFIMPTKEDIWDDNVEWMRELEHIESLDITNSKHWETVS